MKPLRIAETNMTVTHPRSVAMTKLNGFREIDTVKMELAKTEIYETAWEPTHDDIMNVCCGGSIRIASLGGLMPMVVRTSPTPQPSPEEAQIQADQALGYAAKTLERVLGPFDMRLSIDMVSWFLGRMLANLESRGHGEDANKIFLASIERGKREQVAVNGGAEPNPSVLIER